MGLSAKKKRCRTSGHWQRFLRIWLCSLLLLLLFELHNLERAASMTVMVAMVVCVVVVMCANEAH